MISVHAAFKMVEKKIDTSYQKITRVSETGALWIFSIGILDSEVVLPPGICPYSVDKVTGIIQCLSIPPVSNFRLFESATEIKIE